MRTKNNKNNFTPVRFIGENKTILMWDYSPIIINGQESILAEWEEEIFEKKLSFIEIKEILTTYYNKEINRKIISGFEWKNMKIWLSQENQFNYKASYDIALQTNGSNLPIVFKFGTLEKPIYYTFSQLDELKDFYLSLIRFIQDTIEEGWKKKDEIDWEKYNI